MRGNYGRPSLRSAFSLSRQTRRAGLPALQRADIPQAKQQGNHSEGAERAVDQLPVERDAANRSADKRKRPDERAGGDTDAQDEAVANRVEKRPDEEQR